MNGSSAATTEPSWLSSCGFLWLCLLTRLCTLSAPSSSSWGGGYSGDPTLIIHQRIHIRGSRWEHPGMQEPYKGAGDAQLCQLSAGGLPGLQLSLKDASMGTSRGVLDASGFAALPSRCPHRWADIEAPSCWLRAGGIYLY